MTLATIDDILLLAQQLTRAERRQLVTRLEIEFADETQQRQRMTSEEAWAALDRLRAELSARPPGSISMGEQLDLDRRSREQALTGRPLDENAHVHS